MIVREIRAARALMGWTQGELAQKAGVPLRTLKRVELEQAPLSEYADSLRRAFGLVGLEFLSEGDGGVGVRLNEVGA